MNDGDAQGACIVVQRPDGTPAELVLLFHGVGASADDLVPLARRVAQARPRAMVASIGAPFAFDMGAGHQWFSVFGVTEEDRPARVAAALPAFLAAVAHWQAESGVDAERTTLIGFSQGAIMSLESTQAGPQPPAGRVIAIAGRFAQPARRAPEGVALHLIHGVADPVIPAQQSARAAEALRRLGAADTTLDLLPGLGHGIDARVVDLVLAYLGT